MEHLTKHQLILLTLLLTFVTSIATGIVTVSLLEKAPPTITQTINRVVEHTIEKIVPTDTGKASVVTEQVVVKEEDLIVKAVEQNAKSMVVIRGIGGEGVEEPLGLGFIISPDGLVVTARETVDNIPPETLSAIYGNQKLKVQILPTNQENKFAILKISSPTPQASEMSGSAAATTTDAKSPNPPTFVPVSLSDSNEVKLGQTAILLGGQKGTTVVTGIISDLISATTTDETTKKETITLRAIKTSVVLSHGSIGAPLITMEGAVAGVMVYDPASGVDTAVPINDIKNAILTLTAPKKDTSSSATSVSGQH
jgi:hypothetical protein